MSCLNLLGEPISLDLQSSDLQVRTRDASSCFSSALSGLERMHWESFGNNSITIRQNKRLPTAKNSERSIAGSCPSALDSTRPSADQCTVWMLQTMASVQTHLQLRSIALLLALMQLARTAMAGVPPTLPGPVRSTPPCMRCNWFKRLFKRNWLARASCNQNACAYRADATLL